MKNKNNLSLFILNSVFPEKYYRLSFMVLLLIIESVISITSWKNLCLKVENQE